MGEDALGLWGICRHLGDEMLCSKPEKVERPHEPHVGVGSREATGRTAEPECECPPCPPGSGAAPALGVWGPASSFQSTEVAEGPPQPGTR